MSQREYRAAEGISRSELWKINKTPLHFKYSMEHPEDTASLAFGRALHKYVLEKDDFDNDYTVLPEINRRTKAGREQYEQYLLEAKGADKELISQEDMDVIKEMYTAVMANEEAKQLLTGEHEKDFFWTDDSTHEKCKCRPDCLTTYKGQKYIVDYKSTDSCEGGHFERSCRKFGYNFQAGMYTEGIFQNTLEQYGFVFVAQEKKAPYAVRVYFCTPEFVAQGYDKFRELIGIYHSCKQTGNWYGYEGAMNTHSELVEEDYYYD